MKLEQLGQYKFNIFDNQQNLFGYIHFNHDYLSDERMFTYCIIEQLPRDGKKHKFYSGVAVRSPKEDANDTMGFQMALQRACDTMFPCMSIFSPNYNAPHKAYKEFWHQIRLQVAMATGAEEFEAAFQKIMGFQSTNEQEEE